MKLLAIAGVVSMLSLTQTTIPNGSHNSSEILVTPNAIEPLTNVARFSDLAQYPLEIEPGVCAQKSKDSGYSLFTRDGSKIHLESSSGSAYFSSPMVLQFTDRGWQFNGMSVATGTGLTAKRSTQDDTDSNLKSMQDSAKKLKSKNSTQDNNQLAGKKLRVRWLFAENPMPTAELFNSAAIQQLSHTSPIGF